MTRATFIKLGKIPLNVGLLIRSVKMGENNGTNLLIYKTRDSI